MIKIKKHNETGYIFSLMAEDGISLMNSISFTNKADIVKTVSELQRSKDVQHVFERKTNHEGKFLFNVKNANGKLIGQSELYSSEAGMENGIKNVRNRLSSLSVL